MAPKNRYINIVKNTDIVPEKELSNIEKLELNGWTILKPKNNNKINNSSSKPNKPNKPNKSKPNFSTPKNTITRQDWNNYIEKLSTNWNNFRDSENEILGDRSPYIDYVYTIEKMTRENNYLADEIYKIEHNIHSDNDSEYNSDNEQNKNLIF
jgi:hypothetical protein